jgi:RHS repeat-associated protein
VRTLNDRKNPSVTTNYDYGGPDQVELERKGQVSYHYGRPNQYGQPALQSFSWGQTKGYLELDVTGAPLGMSWDTGEYTFVLDALGSPIALVTEGGVVTETYAYDPYGRQTTTTSSAAGKANPIGFTGGTFDRLNLITASRLVHLGHRWYDPNRGRFTQQDNLTVMGDPSRGNRYDYAAADPVNLIDPTGLDPSEDGMGDYMGYVDGYIGFGGVVGGVAGCAIGALPSMGAACPPAAAQGALVGGAIGLVWGTVKYIQED